MLVIEIIVLILYPVPLKNRRKNIISVLRRNGDLEEWVKNKNYSR